MYRIISRLCLPAICLVIFGQVFAGTAQEISAAVAWPQEWMAFGPVDIKAAAKGWPQKGFPDKAALLPDETFKTIPKALRINGKFLQGQSVMLDAENRIDLSAIFGGVTRGKTVYLFAVIKMEEAAKLILGAGAEWYMQWWLNGAPVFDTLSIGNGKVPIDVDNHVFELNLKKGENILAVAVICGSGSFVFAAGNPENKTNYSAAMAEGRRRIAGKGDVLHDYRGAARFFLAAADAAASDRERVAALLDWAQACLNDVETGDYAAVRAAMERIVAMAEVSSKQRSDAFLLMAEAYLCERNYALARTTAARAKEAASVARYWPPAQMIIAQSYLLERDFKAARSELELLLKMESIDELDSGLKKEAETLLISMPLVSVVDGLQDAHPRLFLNRDILEKVKQDGLTPKQQNWLDALKKKASRYPYPPPVMNAELAAAILENGFSYGHGWLPRVFEGLWGNYAVNSALVWLMTGEREYYERAVSFLEHAAAEWRVIAENNRVVYGKAYGRLNGLVAYDWLFNDLPPEKRAEIGRSLFGSLLAFHRHWGPRRVGVGDVYSDTIMNWYLGLVFFGSQIEGVHEKICLELLCNGYVRHVNIFETLEKSGPDAVHIYGAVGYAVQNLNSEVNFLDSYRALTGESFARRFPKRARFANYTLWNTIAPSSRPALTYGWSDEYHIHNRISQRHLPYLMRVPDLYAGMEDMIELHELTAIAWFQSPPDDSVFGDTSAWLTPVAPLLMTPQTVSEAEIQKVLKRLPRARYYPDPVGQTFMNSGWGANDTYALFIAGRQTTCRKHYDENHFTIYKKGFVALDTGARPVGEYGQEGVSHLVNYYYDTVAHNGILIHMEGEQLPGFWGDKATANSGGMNKNYGAQVQAYESDDNYTYIASDATACYHEDKSAEVIRQFLFVCPDYFVVFDRVESKIAGQKKTWLLHTQNEPELKGDIFCADHREGRMFVRTILPESAPTAKIGGLGKEFWNDGKNWPVTLHMQKYMFDEAGNPTPERHLFGNWRMEISAQPDRKRELFLHLIQVGDRGELPEMTPSQLVEEHGRVGVEFKAGVREVRALFDKAGQAGGHIRITEGGQTLLDRPLTNAVMRQEGLALKK